MSEIYIVLPKDARTQTCTAAGEQHEYEAALALVDRLRNGTFSGAQLEAAIAALASPPASPMAAPRLNCSSEPMFDDTWAEVYEAICTFLSI